MSNRLRRRPLSLARFETLESRCLLAAFDILVFSRTTGFRHDSIDEGQAAIMALGASHDFSVTLSEDPNAFTAENLANFEAVVFLNTTGNILNRTQEIAFEQFIQQGGGYVGIHSAADTEYEWGWYGQLMGAHFESHPAIQQATLVVADRVHPSTAHLPEHWIRTDEWYDYRINPRGNVHVLMTIDESTYSGGGDGHDHPISWYHDFDGGRAWYTGLGHTAASYSEPLFLDHLLGGIQYAAGTKSVDGGATVDANYRKVVLDDTTVDPMELDIAPDGRVFYVLRDGKVRIYDPQTQLVHQAIDLAVYQGQEDGLLGIALDPNFATNHWIYLFYSPSAGGARQRVSRFTLTGNTIQLSSERILLEIPTQRAECCHSAGSLDFGPDGTLYISTGDNTNPFESNGHAPIDERPNRSAWDAQKSSANTNDLRGKILRIRPEDDGTYSIPEGNLFAVGTPDTRPEIYVMGNRNPFRISVDAQTGWLYWGDVGPDAGSDSVTRGPRGYDEINQARSAGNFGWPYAIADNQPYRDFTFPAGPSGGPFDPAAPVNDSPNNTGANNLPPAQEAFIWYPYAASSEFPELGLGGRTAMAGPVFHYDASSQSEHGLPRYFDDTLFIFEWSRNWIREVKLDSNGNILKINPFLESMAFRRPMDMAVGPDGAIYMIEWGTNFGGGNNDSQLIRIEYLANVPPVPGDLNRDGGVDAADAAILFANWGVPGPGDLNSDNIVDAADAGILFEHWTGDPRPAATVTGEPQAAPIAPSPRRRGLRLDGRLVDKVIHQAFDVQIEIRPTVYPNR